MIEINLIENGFSINEPFGAKPKLFDWDVIKNVRFSENYKEIIIEKLKKKIVLKNKYIVCETLVWKKK